MSACPLRGFVNFVDQQMTEPITVLIVDDHGVVREGLRAMLEREGLRVVGEARTGREAIALAESLSPKVVLLDIRMPDLDGLQALAAIKARRWPDTWVEIHPDDAARYGIESGDLVRMFSDDIQVQTGGWIRVKGYKFTDLVKAGHIQSGKGEAVAVAIVSEDVLPGMLFTGSPKTQGADGICDGQAGLECRSWTCAHAPQL